MNILVFSDSHAGGIDRLERIAGEEQPGLIVHLGDHVRDAEALRPYAPVATVRGNCDAVNAAPAETVLDIEGVRLLLTHGHAYQVKLSLERLWFHAREREAALALFGHTHIAYCAEKGGVTLFNPGSLTEPRRGGPSYGLLKLENGAFSCKHIFR